MEFEERFRGVFRALLGRDPGADDTGPDQVPGWDSMMHRSLVFFLTAEFGVVFTDREMWAMRDVGSIRRAFAGRLAQRLSGKD